MKFDIIERRGKITSVRILLEDMNLLKKEYEKKKITKLWYRGLPDEGYELLPSIARPQEYNSRTKKFNPEDEKNLLHRFRRRAEAHVGRRLDEWEALFLARHHGLPTRLLDWTANPLVGLFFACEDKEKLDKSACLWAISRIKPAEKADWDMLDDKKLIDKGPFKLLRGKRIKIIHPMYNFPRIIAQDGIFTFSSDISKPLNSFKGKKFGNDNLDIQFLIKWIIPGESKTKIIEELENVGVSRKTVYPDLDGLAEGLWKSEVVWNGKNCKLKKR